MSLILSDLKSLHNKGLSLIYLHPRDKRPIENKWTTGPRKTWEELKRDFHSSYNVGVRLGESSRVDKGYLACIDVDVKNPAYRRQALAKLDEITKGEKYVEVRSGSGNGSRHLYCVSKRPFQMVEIEKHKGKWEICAYSTGRQMVLPPSMHPSGRPYEWRVGLDETALPLFENEKLLSHASHREESSKISFRAVHVDLAKTKIDSATLDKIRDGRGVEDRSAELLSIAMKMCRAGMTDNQILSVLSDENHWISGAAFEHTQSRDRARAVKWLYKYTLLKARHETHPLRLFEGKPDYTKIERTPEKIMEDRKAIAAEKDEVLPDLDGHGKPKSTLRNMVHILEHFLGGALVGYNEFSCRPYFLKDTPYGGKKGREITDLNDLALKHFIACHYRFEPSKDLCFETHTFLAQKHRYHPVKDYLESLEWDGVPRLDRWLFDAFRAEGPDDYVEAVGRKILCAAVARIYNPGCKFDYMTVLEGNQGEGKSISLGRLVGPEWFTDSLGDIHNKDVVDQMIGKWLIEVSELDSIRGREAEAVKAFVSRQVDRVRLSYARRAEDYPRQCIFIGSTNDEEYLSDETGNRRYWPIKVGKANRKWLRERRDQIWSEAKFRYELGEKLYLTKELEEVARREQEKRFEVDDWELEIKRIVSKDHNAFHSTTELWRAVNLSAGNGHPPMYESKRIGKIMKRLGYKRTVKKIDGVRGKVWIRQ